MLVIGLVAGSEYRLAHRSETGFPTVIATFVAQGGICGVGIDTNAELIKSGTLLLIDADDNVVMTS
jgi:hypothetical protein